jgi:hypothetical protein
MHTTHAPGMPGEALAVALDGLKTSSKAIGSHKRREVCHSGLEPRTSIHHTGLLLTRLSVAPDSSSGSPIPR